MTQKSTHKHTQLYDCTTRLHHQAKHNMWPTITDVLWSVYLLVVTVRRTVLKQLNRQRCSLGYGHVGRKQGVMY